MGAADINMREFDPRRFGPYADQTYQITKAKEDYLLRHEIPFPHFNRLDGRPVKPSRTLRRSQGRRCRVRGSLWPRAPALVRAGRCRGEGHLRLPPHAAARHRRRRSAGGAGACRGSWTFRPSPRSRFRDRTRRGFLDGLVGEPAALGRAHRADAYSERQVAGSSWKRPSCGWPRIASTLSVPPSSNSASSTT